MIQDGYAICLNRWALDKDIKNELPILLIISSLTAKTGYCYAGNDFFAKLFDTDECVVSKKIKKLSDKGYIIVDYKRRGCEIRERKIRLSKNAIHDCQKSQPTIVKNDKEKNIINKNINNNIYYGTNDCLPFNDVPNLNREPCTGLEKKEKFIKRKKVSELSAETNAEFEKFWEEYPRKDAKQSALLIYGNLVESHKVTPQQLMDGLAKYVLVIKKEKRERKYIAMPTTWLNQERWLDNADIKIPKKELNPNNLVCCGPRPVW